MPHWQTIPQHDSFADTWRCTTSALIATETTLKTRNVLNAHRSNRALFASHRFPNRRLILRVCQETTKASRLFLFGIRMMHAWCTAYPVPSRPACSNSSHVKGLHDDSPLARRAAFSPRLLNDDFVSHPYRVAILVHLAFQLTIVLIFG